MFDCQVESIIQFFVKPISVVLNVWQWLTKIHAEDSCCCERWAVFPNTLSFPSPLPFSKCDWRDDSPFPPLWTIHNQYTFAARVISVSGWTIAQYRSPVQEVFLPFLPQWKNFNFDKESVGKTGDLLRQAAPREWGRNYLHWNIFSDYQAQLLAKEGTLIAILSGGSQYKFSWANYLISISYLISVYLYLFISRTHIWVKLYLFFFCFFYVVFFVSKKSVTLYFFVKFISFLVLEICL